MARARCSMLPGPTPMVSHDSSAASFKHGPVDEVVFACPAGSISYLLEKRRMTRSVLSKRGEKKRLCMLTCMFTCLL